MVRDTALGGEAVGCSETESRPLFGTELDSSKELVELSDADLQNVCGGLMCKWPLDAL